jgi:hypothetical protein
MGQIPEKNDVTWGKFLKKMMSHETRNIFRVQHGTVKTLKLF